MVVFALLHASWTVNGAEMSLPIGTMMFAVAWPLMVPPLVTVTATVALLVGAAVRVTVAITVLPEETGLEPIKSTLASVAAPATTLIEAFSVVAPKVAVRFAVPAEAGAVYATEPVWPLEITMVAALKLPCAPPSPEMATLMVTGWVTSPFNVAVKVAVPATETDWAEGAKPISRTAAQVLSVPHVEPAAHSLLKVQATQVEAAPQLGVAPVQAPLAPEVALPAGLQTTHAPLSQAGFAAEQDAFLPFEFCESRQATQALVAVLQTGVGAAQLALVAQPVHTLPLQNGADAGHWVLSVHAAQKPPEVTQCGVLPEQFESLAQPAAQAPEAMQTLPAAHWVLSEQATQAWVVVLQCGLVAVVQSALVEQPTKAAQQPLVQVIPEPHRLALVQLNTPEAHCPGARHCPSTQVSPDAQSDAVVHVLLLDDPLEQALSATAAKSDASRAREADSFIWISKDEKRAHNLRGGREVNPPALDANHETRREGPCACNSGRVQTAAVGRLAQMDRASVSEAEGHWFESSIAHQFFPSISAAVSDPLRSRFVDSARSCSTGAANRSADSFN